MRSYLKVGVEMHGELARELVRVFEQAGAPLPTVVCETSNEASFGDASVTLDVNGLRLHVINDRGVRTVEVGLKVTGSANAPVHPGLGTFKDGQGKPTCPLELLAVVSGWASLDELTQHYDLDGDHPAYDESTPPPGPFYGFTDAMRLLFEQWAELVVASGDPELLSEAGAVEEELQRKLQEQINRVSPR